MSKRYRIVIVQPPQSYRPTPNVFYYSGLDPRNRPVAYATRDLALADIATLERKVASVPAHRRPSYHVVP